MHKELVEEFSQLNINAIKNDKGALKSKGELF